MKKHDRKTLNTAYYINIIIFQVNYTEFIKKPLC